MTYDETLADRVRKKLANLPNIEEKAEILGHFSIKTTERYLHVKKEDPININSPLDDLWRSGEIKWQI